jgi:hypothetical protein
VKKILSTLLLFAFLLTSGTGIIIAQSTGNDYMDALQLMRQAKYEEAYEKFSEMLRQNPDNYPVFDQAINSLIQLKRYDEAIRLSTNRLRRNYSDIVLATRLGELYHLNEQFELAYQTWDNAVRANANSIQAYRYVGENMVSRREFAKAIELYLTARRHFNNNSLFFSEITTGYMALGNREKAVETLLDVLGFAPGNSGFVLRQITIFEDESVTEIAILELDERSRNFASTSPEFIAHREVLVGLLLERRLFRRALSVARSYETSTGDGVWPVYSLANRLRSQNQFELASEAYNYYITQDGHPLQARSLEDKAVLYITWSRYLTEFNLDYDGSASSLYDSADVFLSQLVDNFPSYQRMVNVLSLKAELSLDHLKRSDTAQSYVTQIRNVSSNNESRIIADYLDGRIHMFNGHHSLARISLTRANREARLGEIAEKTRYYLALNDFFTGDFEFSALQMRSLERLNTSYYANDALKLRLWMQEGMKDGVASEELTKYANSKFLFEIGKKDDAVEILIPMVTSGYNRPLLGDAILMVSNHLRANYPGIMYSVLDQSLLGYNGALKERLMWEKIRIADGLIGADLPQNVTLEKRFKSLVDWIAAKNPNCSSEDLFYNRCFSTNHHPMSENFSVSDLFELYEEFLFQFPNGFYADQARTRLSQLRTRITS